MATKRLSAVDDGLNYRFTYLLDESKVIRDPTLPPPADGEEEDTRPLVPDPEFVREYVWGKPVKAPDETPAKFSARSAAYLAMATEEAARNAEDERSRRFPTLVPLS